MAFPRQPDPELALEDVRLVSVDGVKRVRGRLRQTQLRVLHGGCLVAVSRVPSAVPVEDRTAAVAIVDIKSDMDYIGFYSHLPTY